MSKRAKVSEALELLVQAIEEKEEVHKRELAGLVTELDALQSFIAAKGLVSEEQGWRRVAEEGTP